MSDICPDCKRPWEEHDFGVPKPFCPDAAPVNIEDDITLSPEVQRELASLRAQTVAQGQELDILRAKLIAATNYAICAYCGVQLPKDSKLIVEHMDQCESHPVRKYEALAQQADKEIIALRSSEARAIEFCIGLSGKTPDDIKEVFATCAVMREALEWRGEQLDKLLAHCADCKGGECSVCGSIICPFGDSLHFHHDGCPACAMAPKDHPAWAKANLSS